MSVIVYGNWPLLTYQKIEYRNPQFWDGEVEHGFDYIVCDRPKIVEAYKEQGVVHVDTELNPVEGGSSEADTGTDSGPVVQVEAEGPTNVFDKGEDYAQLPWPKLKSMASQKAGRNVMTKNEALKVMQEE